MLEAIRNRSGSIVVKALFILLILSFVAWGAGDYLTGGTGAGTVATAGDQEVTADQVQRDFRRQLQQIQRAMPGIDAEQARQLGIVQAVVADLVQKALIRQTALDLGLNIADDVIIREIRTDPTFFDTFGKFSQERFQQIVFSANMTEQGFVQMIREELSRQVLLDSIGRGVDVTEPIVDAVYRHRFEKRRVELVTLPETAVPDVGEPTANELQSFFDANTDRFTAPEYRGATYLLLDADHLIGNISVSEQELLEAYDIRQAEFAGRSTRTLQQMIVNDKETADQAYERLKDGGDFVAVAKEIANLDEASLDLGTVQKGDLPLDELVEPAFALAAGEFSEPVQSPIGWHILKATAAEDSSVPELDAIKDDLTKLVARDRALDEVFKLANQVEDSLSGGATLEDVAQALNIPLKSVVSVDATGRTPTGDPEPDIPSGVTFLNTLFETEDGNQSFLTEAGNDAYFVLHTDRITAPTVHPLADVKADVVTAWKAQAQAKAAETAAEQLAEQARTGQTLEALAAKNSGFAFATPEAFLRNGQNLPEGLPAPIVAKVFAAKTGEIVTVKAGDAAYVAKLVEVSAADPASDAAGVAQVREALLGDVQQDLTVGLLKGLEGRYGVSVNQAALTQVN